MTHADSGTDGFWSGSYRGHTIAILHHRDGWLVYLDHLLQHNMVFATADAAVAWLQGRIDRPSARTEPRAMWGREALSAA